MIRSFTNWIPAISDCNRKMGRYLLSQIRPDRLDLVDPVCYSQFVSLLAEMG